MAARYRLALHPSRMFPLAVASGLALGLIAGGFPVLSREISEAALMLAMTFSLTEISFSRFSLRDEVRGVALSTAMGYLVSTGLLLGFAALTLEPGIRVGWIVMAAVPPAVAVIPVTSLLSGNTRGALLASAFMYLLGLALVPGITLAFLGRSVPIEELVFQTTLLIGVPLVASRPLRRIRWIAFARPVAVAASFFVLVWAITGSARGAVFANPQLLGSLSLFALARTGGLGVVVAGAATLLRAPRDERIAVTAFASFKNLGLAVVLAFSLFGPLAALPAIVSLVFEILWLAALPFLFRGTRA